MQRLARSTRQHAAAAAASSAPSAPLRARPAALQLAPLSQQQQRARRATASAVRCRAVEEQQQQQQQDGPAAASTTTNSLDKQLSKLTRQTASTFAPRASGKAKKNPAVKGTWLYNVFEVQAWAALAVGGLLSFNLLLPTDEPSIPRLMGMWSIWMFTIPSLRAKDCMPREKDALNLLFLLVPLLNVALPFAAKSFPLIFCADVAAVVGVYAWKGVWAEVYGLPLGQAADAAGAAAGEDGSSSDVSEEQQQ